MLTPTLTKGLNAGGTIEAYRIVKFGADDNTVVKAAAAADSLLGVSTGVPAATGERTDVILSGLAEVTYGGNVTRGALLTADSDGRAIAAAPAAGANVRVIGVAWVSGVSGDVGSVLLRQGSMQG